MPKVSFKDELIEKAGFNKYFQAESWEEYNKKFFDGLAPKYDFLNQILSCGLHNRSKKKAIAKISIPANTRILDICTGSGDIAISIAKQNPSCRVIGVDVSQNMLQLARQKANGLANVEFRTADALDLPYQDAEFDIVFMSFGLRNLSDLPKGIREMKRVTKPGGYVTSLDLGKPKEGILRFIYTLYFETLIPFLGRTVFHRHEFNSFQYLPESNKYFPSPNELVSLFESCGLKNVRHYDYMLGGINQQIGIV